MTRRHLLAGTDQQPVFGRHQLAVAVGVVAHHRVLDMQRQAARGRLGQRRRQVQGHAVQVGIDGELGNIQRHPLSVNQR